MPDKYHLDARFPPKLTFGATRMRRETESGTAGCSRRIAPLGVPTAVSADDPRLLDVSCAAYGEPSDDEAAGPLIGLRLELCSAPADDGALDIRVEGPGLTVRLRGAAGEADARSKRARAVLPRELLRDPASVTEITDALLLFLLTRSGRTPLHAAGIVFGGAAAVLAGPSGSGKSTLALAAAAQGLQILSDDTLYIQLQPRARIWGLRRPVHVFPHDAPRFTAATRLRGGKLKVAAPLPPGALGPAFVDRWRLIVLERGERLDLAPLDARAATERLLRLEPGFDLLPRESAEAVGVLAADGAWRLTLTDDPKAAIDFLGERFLAGALAR